MNKCPKCVRPRVYVVMAGYFVVETDLKTGKSVRTEVQQGAALWCRTCSLVTPDKP